MNSTSVGIILIDPDGVIRLANQLAYDYGLRLYHTQVELGKTSLFDLDLSDRKGVEYLFHQVFKGEKMHVELSRQGDAQQYVLDLRYDPVITPDGEVIGAAISFIDITERKRVEEALRQAVDKEKELSELKSRFVSMASHEFRTPLATILAMTETLAAYRHKMSEEQIEQRLEKTQEQIGHLKDIMEDVLQLARMQARRVEFNPVWLDLDALCRSVMDEFANRPDITHQLIYTCSDALRKVKLDRKLMRQIISNLVTNAIKYSPDSKSVIVSLDYTNHSLIFTVRDEGIGIPEADLKHLFEPFHRGANVGTISGTGLGLVITKEAIELHGGTITVESQLGIRTTFTVGIPGVVGEKADGENPGH